MDWSALSALGTAAAAIAALTAAVVTRRVGNDQVRSAIAANGVNLAIQIRVHVNSTEFRAARYRAASALLAGVYSSHVVYLLDELENIGLLINKGVLDQEIIWTMLSALVLNYTAAAHQYIEADRRRNPTLWSNVLSLNDQMIEVERVHGGTDLDATDTYQAYLEMELREMAAYASAAGADGTVEASAMGEGHAGQI
jgi:hypothetical protein